MAVKIVIDSICAPSQTVRETMDMTMVPVNIHFGTEVYKDLVELDSDSFYNKLTTSKEFPTTSAPSSGSYQKVFARILAQGDLVFCLTVDAKFSACHNSAQLACKEFCNEDAKKIMLFDTQAVGSAAALLAIEAATFAQTGATLGEIESHLMQYKPNAKLVVMFDTLKYIEKSGRIGKVAAVAGDLFNIKPLIHVCMGNPVFFGRARGKLQATKLILDEFLKDIKGASNIRVALTHANAEQDLLPLIAKLKELDCFEHMDTIPFTSAMGSHSGPGMIGLGYMYVKKPGAVIQG